MKKIGMVQFNKEKGQVTFLLKALTLIASIVAFVMIIMNTQYFIGSTVEEKQEAQLKMHALNTLQKLITDEKCLAYSYDKSQKKIILDKSKLENFESKYYNEEPNCSLAQTFDYRVNVTALPVNLNSYAVTITRKYSGVFKEVMQKIDGKKTIFVVDESGSMKDFMPGGNYRKIDCVKRFLKAFIEELSAGTKISVIGYYQEGASDECYTPILFPLTNLDSNRAKLKNKVETLDWYGGTPMCLGLKKAFRIGENENIDFIVLMTDGSENSCCGGSYVPCPDAWSVKVAQNNSYLGIPVESIGLGSGADTCVLGKVSTITGGKAYHPTACEELIKINKTKKLKSLNSFKRSWEFGVGEFSQKRVRADKITVSLPVTVRFNEKFSQPGIIKLDAVSGDLESLSSMVNKICLQSHLNPEKVRTSLKLHLSNPTDYSNKKLCYQNGICKKIKCEAYGIDVNSTLMRIETKGTYNVEVEYDPTQNELTLTS